MKIRQTAKQEKYLDEIKKTKPNLTLIDYNEYATLWKPNDFGVSNPNRFYRNIQSKIEQSFGDFHYAFSPLPNSYKSKILTSRSFEDFMTTIQSFAKDVDSKQSKEPEKMFSFMMYYNFFNIGIEGLVKLMPKEFKYQLREQLRNTLLLMQSIANFTKNSGSNRIVPFVHTPDSLLNKGMIEDLE